MRRIFTYILILFNLQTFGQAILWVKTIKNPPQNDISTEVAIGSYIWSSKNLDVTTYRNGDPIPQVTDASAWAALTTGAWCYFNNDSTNFAKYGKIYNKYAQIDARGLAPLGWHIPSQSEWENFLISIGGVKTVNPRGGPAWWYGIGGILKKSGFSGWESPNTNATNSTGFSAVGLGQRDPNGNFQSMYRELYLAVSDGSGSHFDLSYNNNDVRNYPTANAKWGMNVRLLKD
jgi:uncharacterized protein (TIGR02145 family)